MAVRTATLAERTRIAREIHDNVGHMLTRAIMQTEAAHVVAQVAGQEQSAQRFCEIHDTVSEAMTLVRKAVHDLKDEGTDFASQIGTAAHSMDGAGPGQRHRFSAGGRVPLLRHCDSRGVEQYGQTQSGKERFNHPARFPRIVAAVRAG